MRVDELIDGVVVDGRDMYPKGSAPASLETGCGIDGALVG